MPNSWPFTRPRMASTLLSESRSSQSFSRTNMVAPFDWLAWASRLNPTSAANCRTAGSFRSIPSTRSTTASVRCREAPSGSWMAITKKPLSSVGMNAAGTRL